MNCFTFDCYIFQWASKERLWKKVKAGDKKIVLKFDTYRIKLILLIVPPSSETIFILIVKSSVNITLSFAHLIIFICADILALLIFVIIIFNLHHLVSHMLQWLSVTRPPHRLPLIFRKQNLGGRQSNVSMFSWRQLNSSTFEWRPPKFHFRIRKNVVEGRVVLYSTDNYCKRCDYTLSSYYSTPTFNLLMRFEAIIIIYEGHLSKVSRNLDFHEWGAYLAFRRNCLLINCLCCKREVFIYSTLNDCHPFLEDG